MGGCDFQRADTKKQNGKTRSVASTSHHILWNRTQEDKALIAGVVAEIKLSQIALQMLLIDVLMVANHTALEDRKETFKRIGVDIATNAFAIAVINALEGLRRHSVTIVPRAIGDTLKKVVDESGFGATRKHIFKGYYNAPIHFYNLRGNCILTCVFFGYGD
jgi:hypothetical protein